MANRVITATEANRYLSDILSKVQYQRQSFDIKRGKEVIAKLVPATAAGIPISELNDFFKRLPPLDEVDRAEMEQIVKELRAVKLIDRLDNKFIPAANKAAIFII